MAYSTNLNERLLFCLTGLRGFFKGKGKLEKDGSFFRSTPDILWFLKCSKSGFKKARKYLQTTGEIKFRQGRGGRQATHYWILNKPEKPKAAEDPEGHVRAPLDPEMVQKWIRELGKIRAFQMLKRGGYSDIELEKCL